MLFRAADDPLLIVLAAWALVALFVAIPVVLYLGRDHRRGVLGRLRRLIAKPEPVSVAAPPGLPAASEAAGLPVKEHGTVAPQESAAAAPKPGSWWAPPPDALTPGGPANVPGPLAAKPPAWSGSRVSRDTIAPLADRVDRSRRLVACEAKVGLKLSELPRDRWVMDSYVLVGVHRVPFVVLGETGVFGIWPLDGAPHPQDPAYFDDGAKVLQNLLPGYAGEVQAGMCRAFDPTMQPRWWLAPPAKVGGWVMGLDWLIPWLEHFGTEHGLGTEDVARFDRLAGPHWERRAKGVPLSRPPRSG